MLDSVSNTITSPYLNRNTKPLNSSGVVDSETIADVVVKNPLHSAKVKAAAISGSALTSLAFLFALAKKQHGAKMQFKHLFKLDFESPIRAIGLATSATLGGLAGGIIADKKETRKHKLKEGMHQFLGNIITPISLVGLAVSIIEKKNISNVKKKIYSGLAAVGGVVAGVTVGNFVASKVNGVIFKEDDTRKVKAKDFGIHVDDIMTWLALTSKGDTIKSFIGKALPAVYLLCGYEAGTSDGTHHN